MSSVVGVDFGTLNTVIAVARNRGVDVIVNEVSNRATPSLVGFGPKSRYLGEPAKTQEISNLKNTVGSLKRLAGRKLMIPSSASDPSGPKIKNPDVEEELPYLTAPLVDVKGGEVGAEVSYLGEKRKFSATQLTAMFLSKVKQTATNELKTAVSDVVLSVPAWFTDTQRRALLNAADIAGFKTLRLLHDTTAAALGWGITKLDLPAKEEKPRRVAFVDVGHANYTCSIIEFKKGELVVKATAWDRNFGGRNFNKALVEHFQKEFKDKYKIDIFENPKAKTRVEAGVEKLKKVLSANQQAPLNIESLMNDVDVSASLTRAEFEALMEPVLSKATEPLEQALAEAKLKPEDIDIIELVGGSTRVPSLKGRIQSFFGKTLSFTLNQDEAIARGCAFGCAILSPAFMVRDFQVVDICSYPIEFTWDHNPSIPDEETKLTVFNKGNAAPSTKILTFYRKEPFDLMAQYANAVDLPGNGDTYIGSFTVSNVKPDAQNDFMICKLKARVNIHGVLNVEHGYAVEEQEIEEEVAEEGDAMDTDEKENAKPKTRRVKKQVRKGELPITAAVASPRLSDAEKAAATEAELTMVMDDKLQADTEDKKNELETYIYDIRNKIDEQYSEFANEEEKTKIKEKLEQSEDWLYDEGEDATKALYVAKMNEIKTLAGPIAQRYFDKVEEERQVLQAKLDAEAAAKSAQKAAEEEEAKKATAESVKDEPMPDADAPQPETEENKE